MVKTRAECVQGYWLRGQLSVEMVSLVEEGQRLEIQLSDGSKDKIKDDICGDGLIRGDSSVFSLTKQ